MDAAKCDGPEEKTATSYMLNEGQQEIPVLDRGGGKFHSFINSVPHQLLAKDVPQELISENENICNSGDNGNQATRVLKSNTEFSFVDKHSDVIALEIPDSERETKLIFNDIPLINSERSSIALGNVQQTISGKVQHTVCSNVHHTVCRNVQQIVCGNAQQSVNNTVQYEEIPYRTETKITTYSKDESVKVVTEYFNISSSDSIKNVDIPETKSDKTCREPSTVSENTIIIFPRTQLSERETDTTVESESAVGHSVGDNYEEIITITVEKPRPPTEQTKTIPSVAPKPNKKFQQARKIRYSLSKFESKKETEITKATVTKGTVTKEVITKERIHSFRPVHKSEFLKDPSVRKSFEARMQSKCIPQSSSVHKETREGTINKRLFEVNKELKLSENSDKIVEDTVKLNQPHPHYLTDNADRESQIVNSEHETVDNQYVNSEQESVICKPVTVQFDNDGSEDRSIVNSNFLTASNESDSVCTESGDVNVQTVANLTESFESKTVNKELENVDIKVENDKTAQVDSELDSCKTVSTEEVITKDENVVRVRDESLNNEQNINKPETVISGLAIDGSEQVNGNCENVTRVSLNSKENGSETAEVVTLHVLCDSQNNEYFLGGSHNSVDENTDKTSVTLILNESEKNFKENVFLDDQNSLTHRISNAEKTESLKEKGSNSNEERTSVSQADLSVDEFSRRLEVLTKQTAPGTDSCPSAVHDPSVSPRCEKPPPVTDPIQTVSKPGLKRSQGTSSLFRWQTVKQKLLGKTDEVKKEEIKNKVAGLVNIKEAVEDYREKVVKLSQRSEQTRENEKHVDNKRIAEIKTNLTRKLSVTENVADVSSPTQQRRRYQWKYEDGIWKKIFFGENETRKEESFKNVGEKERDMEVNDENKSETDLKSNNLIMTTCDNEERHHSKGDQAELNEQREVDNGIPREPTVYVELFETIEQCFVTDFTSNNTDEDEMPGRESQKEICILQSANKISENDEIMAKSKNYEVSDRLNIELANEISENLEEKTISNTFEEAADNLNNENKNIIYCNENDGKVITCDKTHLDPHDVVSLETEIVSNQNQFHEPNDPSSNNKTRESYEMFTISLKTVDDVIDNTQSKGDKKSTGSVSSCDSAWAHSELVIHEESSADDIVIEDDVITVPSTQAENVDKEVYNKDENIETKEECNINKPDDSLDSSVSVNVVNVQDDIVDVLHTRYDSENENRNHDVLEKETVKQFSEVKNNVSVGTKLTNMDKTKLENSLSDELVQVSHFVHNDNNNMVTADVMRNRQERLTEVISVIEGSSEECFNQVKQNEVTEERAISLQDGEKPGLDSMVVPLVEVRENVTCSESNCDSWCSGAETASLGQTVTFFIGDSENSEDLSQNSSQDDNIGSYQEIAIMETTEGNKDICVKVKDIDYPPVKDVRNNVEDKDTVNAIKDTFTRKNDTATSEKDIVSTKKDTVTSKKDCITSKKQTVVAKKDSTAMKRNMKIKDDVIQRVKMTTSLLQNSMRDNSGMDNATVSSSQVEYEHSVKDVGQTSDVYTGRKAFWEKSSDELLTEISEQEEGGDILSDTVSVQDVSNSPARSETEISTLPGRARRRQYSRRSLSLPTGALLYSDVKVTYVDGHFVAGHSSRDNSSLTEDGKSGSCLSVISQESVSDDQSVTFTSEHAMREEILSLIDRHLIDNDVFLENPLDWGSGLTESTSSSQKILVTASATLPRRSGRDSDGQRPVSVNLWKSSVDDIRNGDYDSRLQRNDSFKSAHQDQNLLHGSHSSLCSSHLSVNDEGHTDRQRPKSPNFFKRMLSKRKSFSEKSQSRSKSDGDSKEEGKEVSRRISFKSLFRRKGSSHSIKSTSPPIAAFLKDEDIGSIRSVPSSPYISHIHRNATDSKLSSKNSYESEHSVEGSNLNKVSDSHLEVSPFHTRLLARPEVPQRRKSLSGSGKAVTSSRGSGDFSQYDWDFSSDDTLTSQSMSPLPSGVDSDLESTLLASPTGIRDDVTARRNVCKPEMDVHSGKAQGDISASNSNDSGIQHDVILQSSAESLKVSPDGATSLATIVKLRKSPSPKQERPKSDITVRWADLLEEFKEPNIVYRKQSGRLCKRPRPKSDLGGSLLLSQAMKVFGSSGNLRLSESLRSLRLSDSLRSIVDMRHRTRDDGSGTQSKVSRRMSTPHPIKSRTQSGFKNDGSQGNLVHSHSMPDNLDKLHRKKTFLSLIGSDSLSLISSHRSGDDSSEESDLSMDLNSLHEKSQSTRSSQVALATLDERIEEDTIYAEALWDHVTMDPDELGFRAGDVIRVMDLEDKDWWYGVVDHNQGWFPAAFVRMRVNQCDFEEDFLSSHEDTEKKMHPQSTFIDKTQGRTNVINEIIQAERDYVKHLRDVVEGYLKQVRKRPEMFPEARISIIFGNIEEIYTFANRFLTHLEKHINQDAPHTSEIGQCFLIHSKGFEIYSDYCNNHPGAGDELKELYRVKKFKHFFEACRLLQDMMEIPLEGFLLTPVQKICKYHLQLAELLKYTPQDHPDYVQVKDAVDAMKNIALLINERKRKMESIEKMAVWQSTVVDWEGPDILEVSSELIYSGDLIKVNSNGWSQERYFFLFDHQLVYCKKDLLKKKSFGYRGRVYLDHVELIPIEDGKDSQYNVTVRNAWKIHETRRDKWYLLMAKTPQIKQRWLKAFQNERQRVREDLENDFNIPAHVKERAINHLKQKNNSKSKVKHQATRSRSLRQTRRKEPVMTAQFSMPSPRSLLRQPHSLDNINQSKKLTWFFLGGKKPEK